jgi:epoxyqueuosine reductase
MRCLVACPTRAFAGSYVLDARRCISYLTIELRGPIPRELRPLMGNWVFGCDVCQEVCPYNARAPIADSAAPEVERVAPRLSDLLVLDEAGFRARYRGTPLIRTKRRGLVRNACVAAGNSGDPALLPALIGLLGDVEPLVQGHAAWAIGRLVTTPEVDVSPALRRDALATMQAAATNTADEWVQAEIQAGLRLGLQGSSRSA